MSGRWLEGKKRLKQSWKRKLNVCQGERVQEGYTNTLHHGLPLPPHSSRESAIRAFLRTLVIYHSLLKGCSTSSPRAHMPENSHGAWQVEMQFIFTEEFIFCACWWEFDFKSRELWELRATRGRTVVLCVPLWGGLGLQGLDFCFTLIIAHKMHVHPPKPQNNPFNWKWKQKMVVWVENWRWGCAKSLQSCLTLRPHGLVSH